MGGGASKKPTPPTADVVNWELTGPDTPTLAWEPRFDEQGREYYENTVTGETQWEVPPLLVLHPRKVNIRYNDVVADYQKRLKFCAVDGVYDTNTLCALCEKQPAARVLWPCAHCCVCKTCEDKHHIGPPDGKGTKGKWPMCPVCMNPIKLVTASHPDAVASYYDWLAHRSKGHMDRKFVITLGFNAKKLEHKKSLGERASHAVIAPWADPMVFLCEPGDVDEGGNDGALDP